MLTLAETTAYTGEVNAKSLTGFRRPIKSKVPKHLRSYSAFFMPILWWAVWEHLRMRRSLRRGPSNPVQPAALLFRSNGGDHFLSLRGLTMPNTPARLLDAQDDSDRLIIQSQALVDLLIANDSFKNVNPDIVGSALWLLSDRLQDLKTTQEKIAKEVRHV